MKDTAVLFYEHYADAVDPLYVYIERQCRLPLLSIAAYTCISRHATVPSTNDADKVLSIGHMRSRHGALTSVAEWLTPSIPAVPNCCSPKGLSRGPWFGAILV